MQLTYFQHTTFRHFTSIYIQLAIFNEFVKSLAKVGLNLLSLPSNFNSTSALLDVFPFPYTRSLPSKVNLVFIGCLLISISSTWKLFTHSASDVPLSNSFGISRMGAVESNSSNFIELQNTKGCTDMFLT